MAEEKLELDWGNEKLQKAQKQIEENQYDLEAWSLLIREAQGKWIGEMRPLFEKLVATFPSTGRYWKIYIEQEMKARNFEKVEKMQSLPSLQIIALSEAKSECVMEKYALE